MSRFWEIVFCVPLLFRRHVCLSNLKHAPSRKLPLTVRKTVFSHLKLSSNPQHYITFARKAGNSVACVKGSPLPQNKSSPDFFWGRGDICAQARNSGSKIKWFAPFRLGSFKKYGLLFEATQFVYCVFSLFLWFGNALWRVVFPPR